MILRDPIRGAVYFAGRAFLSVGRGGLFFYVALSSGSGVGGRICRGRSLRENSNRFFHVHACELRLQFRLSSSANLSNVTKGEDFSASNRSCPVRWEAFVPMLP